MADLVDFILTTNSNMFGGTSPLSSGTRFLFSDMTVIKRYTYCIYKDAIGEANENKEIFQIYTMVILG